MNRLYSDINDCNSTSNHVLIVLYNDDEGFDFFVETLLCFSIIGCMHYYESNN